MTPTQQNYAMIEKELLAVLFGCERFHQYIYGKKVYIHNDHKPLEAIFQKPLNATPPRLQRMLLRLQKYDIHFTYKKGSEMLIADTLSRAFLENSEEEIEEDILIAQIHMVTKNISISDAVIKEIAEHSRSDPELTYVKNLIKNGWPPKKAKLKKEIQAYWFVKEELYILDNGIIMKGSRMVIPNTLRDDILKKLHKAHLGMVKTKERAEETVYWPGINKEIEDIVESCSSCLTFQKQNQKEEMIPSEIPDYPWQTVGTDLFHWDGDDFLLVVDYYSRFIEFEKLYSLKSSQTIKKMKMMFSRYGIPERVRSDSGSQYSSAEFKQFSKDWRFDHITSDPEYPKGNSLAERSER